MVRLKRTAKNKFWF